MRAMAHIRSIRGYLIIAGVICLSYGIYEKCWYADVIGEAVKAIEENRLDQQCLERANESIFASEDLITYNMGVRAYRADNLEKASTHFYSIIDKGHDSCLRKRAYYNIGNILVQLGLPKKAAEMYRESLRLDPTDWESKYNLERLYVFYPTAFRDEGSQASLKPEPDDEGDKSKMGRYGPDKPDI